MKKLSTVLALYGFVLAGFTQAREWEGNNGGRWGGCVVEGTMITLADKTQKPIEQLDGKDLVLSTTGEKFRVIARIKGDETKPAYTITTKDGYSVTATDGHPFFGPEGLVLKASELKVGMGIRVQGGADTISDIRVSDTKSQVYNLVLASEKVIKSQPESGTTRALGFDAFNAAKRRDPFFGLNSKEHSMYVNGIASGDLVIQQLINAK